jgi:hypothetical protein
MERKLQAEKPVKLNALLIGEKTVPKGCRVMNVGQNGMQLQCDDDGRLLTFNDGDSVDVQLTIQHDGKHKKLAIPSWVRNVTANTIEVEFHQPDPLLVDLIESYRSSQQHKLEASLGRKERRIASSTATAGTGTLPAQPAGHGQKQASRPFYSVILATVFTVCVITGGYVYTASIDSRISKLEILSERQSTELAEVHNRIFSASLQEGRYASLNARLTALSDAFVNLENRIAQVIPASAGTPKQVTGSSDKPAGQPAAPMAGTAHARVVADSTIETEATEPAQRDHSGPDMNDVADVPESDSTRPPVAETGPAGSTRAASPTPASSGAPAEPADQSLQTEAAQSGTPAVRNGPWVINLISSRDRGYVERFSEKTGAAQYDAVLNSAMVKGRQYWRLQITGFDSAADARSHAGPVKQALGIKDVWIFRQK